MFRLNKNALRVGSMVVLASVGGMPNLAHATVLLTDSFDYSTGGLSGNTSPNGNAWATAGTVAAPQIVSGNLTTPPGFTAPAGTSNKVSVGPPTGSGGSSTASRVSISSSLITSGSVYYSFELNVSTIASAYFNKTSFISGFNNSTSASSTSPTIAGARLEIKGVDATHFNIGVLTNDGTVGNTAFVGGNASPTSFSTGSDNFVVLGYSFNSGTNADISSLWVNPAALAINPTADATSTGANITSGIQSFFFRDYTAGSGAGPSATADNLRVATTLAEVGVPEPASLSALALGAVGMLRRSRRGVTA